MMMYVGSAGLMLPTIQRARERQNPVVSVCTTGAGIVLSICIGQAASKMMDKVIDKFVDFYDDVKPKAKDEEESENG